MGMSPEMQFIFDILLGLVAFFGGTVINDQRRELRELRAMHAEHTNRFAALPLDYVMRTDYRDFQEALFKKFDRMEDKLDLIKEKVDTKLDKTALTEG